MKKITKLTTLKKILEVKSSEKILEKFHLPCLHCPMAAQEITKLQIGKVAEIYNLDITSILFELNNLLTDRRRETKPLTAREVSKKIIKPNHIANKNNRS